MEETRGVTKDLPLPPPGKLRCPDPNALTAFLEPESTGGSGGQRRLQGHIKSFSAITGFGFIQCSVVKELADYDIFLHGTQVGTAPVSVGATVSFTLKLHHDGRPQARDVIVEALPPSKDGEAVPLMRMDPTAESEGLSRQTYMGVVKSFCKEKGFGFVACDETHKIFQRDVFAHHSKIGGFAVGNLVRFRICVDPVKRMPKVLTVESATQEVPIANGFVALKAAASFMNQSKSRSGDNRSDELQGQPTEQPTVKEEEKEYNTEVPSLDVGDAAETGDGAWQKEWSSYPWVALDQNGVPWMPIDWCGWPQIQLTPWQPTTWLSEHASEYDDWLRQQQREEQQQQQRQLQLRRQREQLLRSTVAERSLRLPLTAPPSQPMHLKEPPPPPHHHHRHLRRCHKDRHQDHQDHQDHQQDHHQHPHLMKCCTPLTVCGIAGGARGRAAAATLSRHGVPPQMQMLLHQWTKS